MGNGGGEGGGCTPSHRGLLGFFYILYISSQTPNVLKCLINTDISRSTASSSSFLNLLGISLPQFPSPTSCFLPLLSLSNWFQFRLWLYGMDFRGVVERTLKSADESLNKNPVGLYSGLNCVSGSAFTWVKTETPSLPGSEF